jgi:hypothetical protein
MISNRDDLLHARALDVKLELRSEAGEGTELCAEVPLG